ncbi:hypothetical protein A3194_12700 [Candidatus Thiodiazotropha endoloripes]|uniref:conjugal transfer protein TraG N-terminal domain-containing protein n=1 Tax=Candidatus Thiodiazotropha endoloripes TaxID=1818881 RepID=UPI00083D24C3|nr:conjugal transfer protein TraG N-terminal domain-containing protein [Candidatus Thiodiazotropha endoloripes]ODB85684.1 hypothetical protein A3194_12700 [Candidatus Thiodiazotropha endoloripes]
MEAGSVFGSYTFLFGWYIFDMLVGVLQATALWLLPFFVVFFESTIGQAGAGSYRGFHERSLGTMEVGVYVKAVVIAFSLLPLVSVNSSSFTYSDETSTYTPGNTNTTFDNTLTSLPPQVQVPLLWYTVSSLAGGINAAIEAILPDQEDIRSLMHSMGQLSIHDPALQAEVRRFNRDCYQPSISAIRSFNLGGDSSAQAPVQMVTDYNEAQNLYEGEIYGDLSYIGARQLLNTRGLYRLCNSPADCPHQDAIGPYSPVSGWETIYDFSSPARSGPSCADWWSSQSRGLKQKLVTYMETERSDITDSIADSFTDWGASIGVVNAEDRGDAIVQRALSNTGSLIYGSNSAEGHNSVTNFKDFIDWVVGTFSAVTGNGILSLLNGVIVDSLPLLQGYLVLIIAALLPLVMLVTLYSPKPVITLAFFMMAVLLWPGMWSIARWIDNVLLESIFDGYSILGMQLNAPAAILSIIAMLGYIGIPVVFSKMLVNAGMDAGELAQGAVGNLQQGTQGSVRQGSSAAGGIGKKVGGMVAKNARK